MTTKISIFGASGRMGKALVKLIEDAHDLHLAGALGHEQSENLNQTVVDGSAIYLTADIDEVISNADIVIDFALATGCEARVQACRERGIPMLIGTTGLNQQQLACIESAATDIPILWSSNMSLGVNLVFALAARAAEFLGPDFDIHIEETHHIHKKDAPSGTALSIGKAIHEIRADADVTYDSYREGEVVGDHHVIFDSEDEYLEIYHHAKDRTLFAKGALKLARILVNKEKGLYQVKDLL